MNLFQIATRGIDLDTAPITPDDESPREGFRFEEPAVAPSRLRVPAELDEVFSLAAQEYGVDVDVLRGIAYAESRFNPDIISGKVKSKKGAIGLMQFMPDTAKEYGIEPTDPVQSIIGGAAYLRKSLDKFDGDYERAVASYNWGPNRKAYDSDDWASKAPRETQKYLMTVFGAVGKFKDGAAERGLPQGVAPSKAGAGRGVVNPGMVNTQETQAIAGRTPPPPSAPADTSAMGSLGSALNTGFAKGVVKTGAGLGTFLQDPGGAVVSGLTGAGAMLDRGVSSALSAIGIPTVQNPQVQRNAQIAAESAQQRRGDRYDAGNPLAVAGRFMEEDSRRVSQELQEKERTQNPRLMAQQKAISEAEGFVGNLKAAALNPIALAGTLSESVFPMAAGVGSGSLVSRLGGGMGAVSATGTASEAGFAALNAREGVYQAVATMPLEKLSQSPRFQQILRSGNSPTDARELLANELADQTPLMTAAGTAGGTLLTNRLFGGDATAKTIVGAERMTAKELGKRVSQDTVEEVIQGVPEDLVQYGTLNQADPTKKLDLAGSAAQNMVGGFAFGVAGHGGAFARDAMTAPTVESQPTTPQAPPVAPAAPVQNGTPPVAPTTPAAQGTADAIMELERRLHAAANPTAQPTSDAGTTPVAPTGNASATAGAGGTVAAVADGQPQQAQALTDAPSRLRRIEALNTEHSAIARQLEAQGQSIGDDPLGKAIQAATSPLATRDADWLLEALTYSEQTNRTDIAQEVKLRLTELADKLEAESVTDSVTPGVATDNPKYETIAANLRARRESKGLTADAIRARLKSQQAGAPSQPGNFSATPTATVGTQTNVQAGPGFTGKGIAAEMAALRARNQPAPVATQPATQQAEQPRTTKAAQPAKANLDPQGLLSDDERQMLGEFTRLYQTDLKADIRQRLGLTPKEQATAPTEKKKPSALLSLIVQMGGIKSGLSADLTGANAMEGNRRYPGLFRNNGKQLDVLVQSLKERGYLTQADEDSILDNGGTNKLADMIQAELSGERAKLVDNTDGFADMRDADMRQGMEDKATALGLSQDMVNSMSDDRLNGTIKRIEARLGHPIKTDFSTRKMSRAEARAEREAILMADRYERARAKYDAELQAFAEADDMVQDAVLDVVVDEDGNVEIVYARAVEVAAASDALNGTWSDQNAEVETRRVGAGQENSGQAGPPVASTAESGAGNPEANRTEAGAGSQEALTTYTPEEVTAKQDGLKFSRKAKVETNERNLIIQHNLSSDNLLHAVKMGGIAVPSLAVTTKTEPLTGFGEITLIGSVNMADPKGYAGTKVFGADIYSPRYPSVTFEFTPNMRKRGESMLKDGMAATDSRYLDWSEVERDGARELKRQPAVMWQFLKSKGIEPVVMRAQPKPLADRIMPFKDDTRHAHELAGDPAFAEAVYQTHLDMLIEAYGGDAEAIAEATQEVEKLKATAAERGRSQLVNSYAQGVNQYQRDARQSGQVDREATRRALENQVREADLTVGLRDYAASIVTDLNPNERIFQGFTNSGNRKYIPHTLENVVKLLKKELRGGEGFNYGVGSLRAKFTPQFKSVADIRNNKDRLISSADFDKVKDEINAEFLDMAEAIGIQSETLGAIMEDAAKMGVTRAAATYDVDVGGNRAVEIAEFMTRLRNLPTAYFEAKILRDVDLAEFSAAVIPSDASQKVRSALESRGVTNVFTYERNNEADRKRAIQEAAESKDDLAFSKATDRKAAQAALARIMENGVTSPDDLRALLRVPGYSQWAKSALAGDMAASTALRSELADAFGQDDWRAPKLNQQGIVTLYPDWSQFNDKNLEKLTELADKYDAPIALRGGPVDPESATEVKLSSFGFERYNGMQERADRLPGVLFGMIRPAGGITSTTPLFSQTPAAPPKATTSTIRQAITKAYGNLLPRLEGKGLVTLTQTEEEAIAAAAQARADKTGGDVEAIKDAMRASVLASQRGTTTGIPETQAFTLPKPLFVEKFSQRAFESFIQDFDDGGVNNWDQESITWRFENVLLPTIREARKKGIEYIDFYHVTDADLQDFSGEGIFGSAVDNTGAYSGSVRKKAVYGFLDPDDIKAGFDGVLGSTSETPNVLHVKIPIDKVGSMFWDGNFNISFGTYSGVSQSGSIPYEWIDGAYEFNSENGVFSGRAEFKNQPDSPSAPTSQGVDVKRSVDGNLEGFFDPATGKSFLIADNLTAESAPATLMHEVGIHMAAEGKFGPMFDRALTVLNDGSLESTEALRRMQESGETSGEEAAAYLVTVYETNRTNAPASVKQWMKDMIAAVRAWLFNKGVLLKADQLTVADIAAVARANAKSMAVGDSQGDVRNSKQSTPDKRESQIESENFKRWFGDSKVVDANGKPLVVYHGTGSDFSSFDRTRIGQNFTESTLGFYFTNAAKPDFENGFGFGSTASEYANNTEGRPTVMPVYLSIKNPLVLDDAGEWGGAALAVDKRRSDIERWAKDGNHDGVLVFDKTGEDSERIFIAFKSTQIKSAIGNNGNFDPANPDIRRSISNRAQQPLFNQTPAHTWEDLGESYVDTKLYNWQDDRIDLKRVQESITKAGRQIDDQFDARTAETLLPGRLAKRTEDFMAVEAAPLLKDMAKNNVTMEEVSDYMLARHAPERNAQIAKVNPDMPDAGSGTNSEGVLMTTQAANDHIAALTTGKRMVLEMLARRVDAITKGTRDLLVAEGLEKAETIRAWEGAYKHYVPLFRDEAANTPGHPVGSGISVTGSASKRATGSTKEVTNMLAHVLMQREAAITRAEKNRVSMSLYGMALSHPNKAFWSTVQPNMSTADIVAELQRMGVDPMDGIMGMDAAPTIRTVDDRTGLVVDRPNPMYKKLDNAIVVKVNGEDRVILFNTKNERAMRMAQSLKNQHFDQGMWVNAANTVAPVTRFMAAMMTQYNPAFGMVNAVRDIQGALVNLTSTPLNGKQARVLADTPAAVIGIARDIRGDGKRTPWSDLWVQFQEDGGRIGYRDLVVSPYERAANMEKDIKRMQQEGKWTPGNAAHAVLDLLGDFNDSLENGVRLAAYKAALDKGMTRPQAAKLARELTVDFNRKGRKGRELGKLYAFLNASIQGNARNIATVMGAHGGKVLAGGFALGVLQALMLAAAGYEDDEIREFQKARALIIPIGGKQHITIPMALGFHVIPNTSRILTELMLTGGKDWQTKVPEAMFEIANAANPFGGGGDWKTAHGPLTMAMPTAGDWAVDLALNRDFTGNQISRTRYNERNPGSAIARESTLRTPSGQVYQGISKAINDLTGGSDRKAGAVSPTPEELRYIMGVVGGGVYRETEKAINAAVMLVNGDEIKATQVPLGSRFVSEVRDEDVQRRRYYKNTRKLEDLEADLKDAAKERDSAKMNELRKDKRTNAIGLNNAVQRHITQISNMAKDDIGDKAALAKHDANRAAAMRRLNDEVLKLEKQAQ